MGFCPHLRCQLGTVGNSKQLVRTIFWLWECAVPFQYMHNMEYLKRESVMYVVQVHAHVPLPHCLLVDACGPTGRVPGRPLLHQDRERRAHFRCLQFRQRWVEVVSASILCVAVGVLGFQTQRHRTVRAEHELTGHS